MLCCTCENCELRSLCTSAIRFTPRLFMSALNSWSRNTVSPSLSDSWNQSRHVTRFPVQLWKYCHVINTPKPTTQSSTRLLPHFCPLMPPSAPFCQLSQPFC